MRVLSRMKYSSAIIINDEFLLDIDELLQLYFGVPSYKAKLINGDEVKFESVYELIDYDNFSVGAIKSLNISFGFGNDIYIEPTISFISNYASTIELRFEVDSNDKSEEVKRKLRLIFDKHKQSTLYTLASKLSCMQISIAMILLVIANKLIEFIIPSEEDTLLTVDYFILFAIVVAASIVILILLGIFKSFFPPILFCLGGMIKSKTGAM